MPPEPPTQTPRPASNVCPSSSTTELVTATYPADWFLDRQLSCLPGKLIHMEEQFLDAPGEADPYGFLELDNGEVICVLLHIDRAEQDLLQQNLGSRQVFEVNYEIEGETYLLPEPRFGVESGWTEIKEDLTHNRWVRVVNGIDRSGYFGGVNYYGRIEAVYLRRRGGNIIVNIGCGTIRTSICSRDVTYDEHGMVIPPEEVDRVTPGSFVQISPGCDPTAYLYKKRYLEFYEDQLDQPHRRRPQQP